jgi:transcriptional regulator with XRE-family HTH domain
MNEHERSMFGRTIRRRLTEIRKARGLSGKGLSLILGMPFYAINNLEAGVAVIPHRVKSYCEWAGFPGDYAAIEDWLKEAPEDETAPAQTCPD